MIEQQHWGERSRWIIQSRTVCFRY